jgi:N-acetyl-anhydromuramyl-L-alanine amidase AmpD
LNRLILWRRVAVAVAVAFVIVACGAQKVSSHSAADVPQPRIVSKPIPFGPARRAETAAYARRHYGIDTWRLRHPHVIVEHYTANDSLQATINTFSSDAPDPELGERPGTCAHFVIDRDGTIHQLVSLKLMCRHTVGLNYTAIGIEHVGMSDGDLMGDQRQLDASLQLTRWLQARYGILTRNVIGHAESLGNPYHHENVGSLKRQTHGDMRHATMARYRRLLSGA